MEEQRGIERDAKRYVCVCAREERERERLQMQEREREREIANARDKDRKKYCKRSGQSHFQRKKKKK